MKTARTDRRQYCSVSALRYACVLCDMDLPEEVVERAREAYEACPELGRVLESPAVGREDKRAVIDRVFQKEIRSFLKVVVDNGKADLMGEIFAAYRQKQDELSGTIAASLAYVTPPSQEQLAKMEQFLCRKFQAAGVSWEMEERPELIGGFLLRVNGIEYDYSLQGRLDRLEQKLTRR